jgi:mannose-1-phosphate guanylyltransferase
MQPDISSLRPVILCGGFGRRLAPLSTPQKPKAFLKLLSQDHSMFQETIMRVRKALAPAILCNADHRAQVNSHLAGIKCTADVIISEPVSKNTAPAFALAAKNYEGSKDILLFLPCDHKIKYLSAFHEALKRAITEAKDGHFVLFGEKPSCPDTGLGYILPEGSDKNKDILAVQAFHEKPDMALAASYIDRGALWNMGIVMVRADVLAAQFREHQPWLWQVISTLDVGAIDRERFQAIVAQSFDKAILEKIASIKMCPVDLGWADIGTLDRLAASA